MTRIRVCVVSGSRADYGLVRPVMARLNSDSRFELLVIATGMHLSSEFGRTVTTIRDDGFPIVEEVESLVSGDSPAAIAKSVGLGLIGFADAFRRHRPDWLLVLGDRYEIFAAVQAALLAAIPIAHIAGGDTSEGAFDEAIRHSISKMAHLHFPTNEPAARRLRQMGEDPKSIHVVGSPGLEAIRELELPDRITLEEALAIELRSRNLLITYHPVTLDKEGSVLGLDALLSALGALGDDVGLVFTHPNADPDGLLLARKINDWAKGRPNAKVFQTLGSLHYLGLMREVDAVVGNSSSGLYEAVSLGTPTVDIGDRQQGRLAAGSVIHCRPLVPEIVAAINSAFELDVSGMTNPYGDGHASERIVEALAAIASPTSLLKKRFYSPDG